MGERRVVVTGLGMAAPTGLNVKDAWDAAINARSAVGRIRRFPTESLPVRIAAEIDNVDLTGLLDQKEAKRLSRFVTFAVKAAAEAMADAGLDSVSHAGGQGDQSQSEASTNASHTVKGPENCSDDKTRSDDKKHSDDNVHSDSERLRWGVSIGVGMGALEEIEKNTVLLHDKGAKRISPFFMPYTIANMAAGVVSRLHGLKGPNICPTTACTSGTHGVGEGFTYIVDGRADLMVVGGAESAVSPLGMAAFAAMRALSTNNDNPSEASRPFDRDRDGFVMGEGSGLLVLEELQHAKRRRAKIYAEVVGYGMSGDAFHISAPAPGGAGAVRCMENALIAGRVPYDELDYINAHGTSTDLNDRYESEAISSVFGDRAKRLAISSTKGVTGHCLGAAGGIEAVYTTLAIRYGIIPPTANLRTPDPLCPLDYTPLEARERPVRFALSNSFGFGGTNASIVLRRFEG